MLISFSSTGSLTTWSGTQMSYNIPDIIFCCWKILKLLLNKSSKVPRLNWPLMYWVFMFMSLLVVKVFTCYDTWFENFGFYRSWWRLLQKSASVASNLYFVTCFFYLCLFVSTVYMNEVHSNLRFGRYYFLIQLNQ